MPFPRRLSAMRKERGFMQEALAELIVITKTRVYRYERGSSQPTLDVIKKPAVTLSIITDELIFEASKANRMTACCSGSKALAALMPMRNTSSRKSWKAFVLLKRQPKRLIRS